MRRRYRVTMSETNSIPRRFTDLAEALRFVFQHKTSQPIEVHNEYGTPLFSGCPDDNATSTLAAFLLDLPDHRCFLRNFP